MVQSVDVIWKAVVPVDVGEFLGVFQLEMAGEERSVLSVLELPLFNEMLPFFALRNFLKRVMVSSSNRIGYEH